MMMSLLLVVALVAPSLSVPLHQCPGGWKLLEKTCFLVSWRSGSWNDGMEFCNKQGGTMATLSSKSQHRALSAMLTDGAWISLNVLDNNNGWADGRKYQYTSGKPNGLCLVMETNGRFREERCTVTRRFLCSAPAQHVPHCHGWESYGGSCYRVSNTGVSWGQAQSHCKNEDAHLVQITSSGEDNFVRGLLTRSAWIGLHKVGGSFVWDDGSHLSYTNWLLGQPDNFLWNEHCVEMKWITSYKWNDYNCKSRLAYVCEKPPH